MWFLKYSFWVAFGTPCFCLISILCFNFSAGELIIKPLRNLEFLEQGIYNFYYFGFSDFHSQS